MLSLKLHKPIDQKEDNDRLTKDLTKIFGIIAKRLIQEEPNAYQLEESEIESNGIKRPKTLRFLREAGAMRYRTTITGKYGSDRSAWNFKEVFDEVSKEYAFSDTFPEEPREITDYLKNREVREDGSFRINSNTLDNIGYKNIHCLFPDEAIFIFWNIQDYDVKKEEKVNNNSCTIPKEVIKTVRVYPKAKLLQRNKAILKALLKKFSEMDFKAFMEKRFKDNYDGQTEITLHEKCELTEDPDAAIEPDEINFGITLRNFAAFSRTLGEPLRSFLSRRGYVAEYKRKSEAATFEYNRLKRLVDQVHAAGGCPAIAKDYIQECCNEIVSKAPLLINGDDGEKIALQYILDHRDVFKYDYIYA